MQKWGVQNQASVAVIYMLELCAHANPSHRLLASNNLCPFPPNFNLWTRCLFSIFQVPSISIVAAVSQLRRARRMRYPSCQPCHTSVVFHFELSFSTTPHLFVLADLPCLISLIWPKEPTDLLLGSTNMRAVNYPVCSHLTYGTHGVTCGVRLTFDLSFWLSQHWPSTSQLTMQTNLKPSLWFSYLLTCVLCALSQLIKFINISLFENSQ
jgi:hypothetical protein